MSRLIAFGDSFTFGSDLGDVGFNKHKQPCTPSNSTWCALLSTYLDKKYLFNPDSLINLHWRGPGKSNADILRYFIEAVPTLDDSYVVINWTWIDRYTICNTISDTWISITPNSLIKEAEIYYKYFHSELKDKYQNLVLIDYAIKTLKQHNIPFLMTMIDPLVFDQTYHAPDYVKYLQDQVYPEITWFEGLSFLEWSMKNQFPISENWHPLEEAHRAAFEYIKNRINF